MSIKKNTDFNNDSAESCALGLVKNRSTYLSNFDSEMKFAFKNLESQGYVDFFKTKGGLKVRLNSDVKFV